MKDCGEVVRTAFFTALDENITYGSNVVPVWDEVPADENTNRSKGNIFYYILISDTQVNEITGNKDKFMYDCSQLIEIVVGFPGMGNKMVGSDLADQVMQIIKPNKGDVLTLNSDFRNIKIELESNLLYTEQDSHIIVRNLLRYSLEIEEI